MKDKTIERLYISTLIMIIIIASLYFNNQSVFEYIITVISYLAGILTPTKFIKEKLNVE
jgi:general stress protein CsbA